jgi:hypothetical protein
VYDDVLVLALALEDDEAVELVLDDGVAAEEAGFDVTDEADACTVL